LLHGKPVWRNPMTNERRGSDRPIVPTKRPNKADKAAEDVEGRGRTKGNPNPQNTPRLQDRNHGVTSARERVRKAAKRDRRLRFTSLLHQVYDIDALREAYFSLKRNAAAGVDGVTWRQYGERLEENLQDLAARLKRGGYRAAPVRRAYITKEDGRKRPLGVTVLEDKVVQAATVAVLNAIYEIDFVGFSYGFRPNRSQHDALDAVTVGIERKKVNWVLDADISGFFDAIDHECLVKFVRHRIADERVVRLIQKWLKAGVLEDGRRTEVEVGTPQGGVISPLLANIYLHYVFDLWAHQWRKRHASGEVIVVRYADDFIVGFESEADAMQFQQELGERLAKFGLKLHPDKTRLMGFGRFEATRRKRSSRGKPETFDFLGFTHYCSTTRNGRFAVKRRTMSKRMRRKLKELSSELRRRMHYPTNRVGAWLASVVTGHMRYYGVPFNYRALSRFRQEVIRLWLRSLRRRSQKDDVTWAAMHRLATSILPTPRLFHPHPGKRLVVTT